MSDDRKIELGPMKCMVTGDARFDEWEQVAGWLIYWQKNVNWWIGDMAVLAEQRLRPQLREAIWPENTSPDHVARCRAVSLAYPVMTRNANATWSIHMRYANNPNRVALVQAAVDAGQTTDENRDTPLEPSRIVTTSATVQDASVTAEHATQQTAQRDPATNAPETPAKPRSMSTPAASQAANATPVVAVTERATDQWLLCVDVNGYVSRLFFAGAELDAAAQFVQWLINTVRRLKEKGLTAIVCCMDSTTSNRKTMTADWEVPYKSSRKPKQDELTAQLNLVRTLLVNRNADVVVVDGWEADDVMASYAAQYNGRVTLMSMDKDMRQCLSSHVNILEDVKWEQDANTGTMRPTYKWTTADSHKEQGITYQSDNVTGISPQLWPLFQAIAGDTSDTITGVKGIGPKGAAALVQRCSSIADILAEARDGGSLTAKQRQNILAWEPYANTMLALTTLRTDLQVPTVLTINLQLEQPTAQPAVTEAAGHESPF